MIINRQKNIEEKKYTKKHRKKVIKMPGKRLKTADTKNAKEYYCLLIEISDCLYFFINYSKSFDRKQGNKSVQE